MEAESFTGLDFEEWLRPSEALDILSTAWGHETSARWIAGRLISGLIVAGAAAVMRRPGSPLHTFVKVPADAWQDWACLRASDFWKTGDVTLYRGGSLAGQFHDVRFHPSGFVKAIPSPGDQPAGEGSPSEKPIVARADLARWHQLFVQVYPNAAEALAQQSAAAMFPNHRVPRQYVRDLRGPQKRGKPPSRQQ
jgi:hypothetical protein